ncbi:hypothetical protein CEXT_364231 [Caerostris extrusa]|uniref:Uncharacterized protein n=1 Tax=Caerostris extrusa TaxID=172846 RepID=A0AAV4X3Z4_CAEEX|nr:hypothetical protein CEXT_364231 [Caerostris extrusa]
MSTTRVENKSNPKGKINSMGFLFSFSPSFPMDHSHPQNVSTATDPVKVMSELFEFQIENGTQGFPNPHCLKLFRLPKQNPLGPSHLTKSNQQTKRFPPTGKATQQLNSNINTHN